MCRLLLFFSLFFSATVVLAAPVLVVERSIYDFGEITQGESLVEVFRFQNAGDQMLEVGNIRSSCGCTQALLTSNRLEPGAIGELQLTFNSEGFKGPVQKTVSFSTNDPNNQAAEFILRGKVNPELFVQPDKIRWGVVSKETPLVAELQIVNESKETITLRNPKVTNESIVAMLSAQRILPGKQVTLKVTAVFPPDKNRLAGYVLINTDLPNVKQLRVSASARLAVK